jgi:PAS domain-containing protein
MRAGAGDYVLKDKLARLPPAVEREVREGKVRTARRQAEQAFRSSEARFARLSESGIIGIVRADVLGNVHEANDAYLSMLGHSRAEVLSGIATCRRRRQTYRARYRYTRPLRFYSAPGSVRGGSEPTGAAFGESSRTWCRDGRRTEHAEPATRLPVARRPSPVLICGCRLRLPTGNCRFRKRNPLPTMGAQNDTTRNDDVPIPVGEARAFVQAETPSPILDVPSLGTAIEKAIRPRWTPKTGQ